MVAVFGVGAVLGSLAGAHSNTLATALGARGVFAVSGLALLLVTAVAARTLLRAEPASHRLPAPSPA